MVGWFSSRWAFAVILVCATAALAEPKRGGRPPKTAPAPPPPPVDAGADAAMGVAAREAKARGDAFMDSGRPAEALSAYTEAATLSPDPALHYNRARAYEKLGQFPSALEWLERFEREAPAELRARVPKLDQLMASLRKRTCLFSLQVNVPGAEVRLGDRVIGKTPLTSPLTVEAGKTSLRVVAEGYFDVTRALDLPGAGRVSLELTMASKATDALLRVESTDGATLQLDEAPERRSVPVETPVSPGSHRVRLSLDGHLPLDTTLVLAAGEVRTARLLLTPETPLWKRWYFWVGVVAIVAAGVTTGIALTTERAPLGGSLGITSVKGAP